MLKVLSLFSGIGAFEKALTRCGVKYELVAYCEIDQFAPKSYEAIHGNHHINLTDVRRVSIPSGWVDLLVHGSPCQDVSVAGKGKGAVEGSGTRSSLLWESVRIIRESKPRYVLWENVKAVLNVKHRAQFDKYLEALAELGYNNHYKVLNSRHYGVPQNRERVYVVSILNDNREFVWPDPFDNGVRLKDILEDVVDEKYYISGERCEKLLAMLKEKGGFVNNQGAPSMREVANCIDAHVQNGMDNHGQRTMVAVDPKTLDTISARTDRGVSTRKSESTRVLVIDDQGRAPSDRCPTLRAQDHGTPPKVMVVGELDMKGHEEIKRVYSPDGLSPTITAKQGGNHEPKILQTARGLNAGGLHDACPSVTANCFEQNNHVVRVPLRFLDRNGTKFDGDYSFCVDNSNTGGVSVGLRIRKFTPLECWRLMGFDDEDFRKAEKVNSNTQLYKQAGNSIVVNVLELIFKELFKNG